MRLVDIHSHILPAVDDGAKDVEASVKLLEAMKTQGITDVIATPHFYASEQNIDDFRRTVREAKEELDSAVFGLDLPKIIIGAEVHYFRGIGKSNGITELTLGNSNYMLLELSNSEISQSVLNDIRDLSSNFGITPIIAHVERYANERGFKKLLDLIASGVCYAQVNATSVLYAPLKRVTHKLMKKGYISFVATDSHSPEHRPPLMGDALELIKKDFGNGYLNRLIKNSDRFCEELSGEE